MKEIGDSIRDVFLLPGDLVMLALAPRLGIIANSGEFLLSVSISILLWLLLLIGVWKFVMLGRSIVRRVGVAIRARFFLLKTKLSRPSNLLMPKNRASNSDPEIEVEFDDLDLAVLGSARELSQGFVLSAPDVAAQLKLRPTQVQSSLEKLKINMMLERALGSTDDYENYRLTRAGAAFLAMLHRNEGEDIETA